MRYTIIFVIIALFALQSSADFASDCLDAQNAYRTPLNIAPLSWSNEIARSAQAWAETLAAQRSLEHSSGGSYGENLACRTGQYDGGSTSSSSSSSSNNQNTNSGSNSNSNSNYNSDSSSGSNGNTDSSQNTNNQNSNSNSNSNGDSNSYNTNNSGRSRRRSKGNSNNNSNNNGNSNSNYNSNGDSSNGDSGSNTSSNNNNNYYDDSNSGNSRSGRRNRNRSRNNYRNLGSTSLINSLTNQWGYEKENFVYGTFPDVSTGGTVGHYTQMIWGNTQQVGCGIANNDGGWVYFVCQYYPSGNWRGETVY